jgi:hypothetical protein
MTGHSLAVCPRSYAGSFGKAQRNEARARLLEHGFGLGGDYDDVDGKGRLRDPAQRVVGKRRH